MSAEAIQIHPTNETLPFWNGAREGRLVLQRCARCERFRHYPREICPHCFSSSFVWAECKGTGTVYSFTVVHRAPSKAFASQVPYVVANIELAEGVHMMSRIIDCSPDRVDVGMSVRVRFDDVGGVHLPVFVLDEAMEATDD